MESSVYDSSPELKEFVASVMKRGEDLIKNAFPKRIDELNKLLDSEDFNLERQQVALQQTIEIPIPDSQLISRVRTSGKKMLTLPSGPIPCNPLLSKQNELVKPYLRELVEHTNDLKMWVKFLIPKIEDGNDLGVAIQQYLVNVIKYAEQEAENFSYVILEYHRLRGDLLTNVMKHPNVDNYRKLLAEYDERQFIVSVFNLTKLRDHYASLYDKFGKNWEKIMKPRSSNMDSMY